MSRFVKRIDNRIFIAYGYDHMILQPGYFLQVFDTVLEGSKENPEGIIENEGFVAGIGKGKMFELFEKHNLLDKIPEDHKQKIALDLPI